MELVKRKATTRTMKITAEIFEDLEVQFLTDIETVSMLEDIPKDLIHMISTNATIARINVSSFI